MDKERVRGDKNPSGFDCQRLRNPDGVLVYFKTIFIPFKSKVSNLETFDYFYEYNENNCKSNFEKLLGETR